MERQKQDLSEISYSLVNSTNANILMSFMSNPTNNQDISNQYTSYAYNVTGVNFSPYNFVSITYRTKGSTLPPQTTTVVLMAATIDGVVVALNSIGISSFFWETVAGNTYIKTYNDNIEFFSLVIDNNSLSASYITYEVAPNGITTGVWFIDAGGVNILSGSLGTATPTTDITASFLPALTCKVYGDTPTLPHEGLNVFITDYNNATGQTTNIYAATIPSGMGSSYNSPIFPFVPTGHIYSIILSGYPS